MQNAGLTFSPTTVSISETILAKYPFFVIFLLGVIALSVFKFAFGKEIIKLLWLIKSLKDKAEKKRKINDWVAECKERVGWKQKADAHYLDLEGKYVKKLSFNVIPTGKPENWRAGLMIGDERFRPQDIVDTTAAITIHVGSPPVVEKGIHVWKYDSEHPVNHPDEAPVLVDKGGIKFRLEINNTNFLSVYVGNQPVYQRRIDSSFRKKLYLLAWADNFKDCKVGFEDIRFSI